MRLFLESLVVGGVLLTGAALQLSGRALPSPAQAGSPAPVAASPAASPSPANGTGPATAALPSRDDRPGVADAVYSAGGQFTAHLDQTRNRWLLQPLAGKDLEIDAGSCASGFVAATGVWLLVVDRDGSAELVAPSATHLPAGSPDRVALRGCNEATGEQLAVPRNVLDLLTANTGAVYVDR